MKFGIIWIYVNGWNSEVTVTKYLVCTYISNEAVTNRSLIFWVKIELFFWNLIHAVVTAICVFFNVALKRLNCEQIFFWFLYHETCGLNWWQELAKGKLSLICLETGLQYVLTTTAVTACSFPNVPKTLIDIVKERKWSENVWQAVSCTSRLLEREQNLNCSNITW